VRAVLLANPLTGALEAYRGAWLGEPIDLALLAGSCLAAALLCLGALWVFHRLEHRFGDLL
jgi:ABC-type polysaccharide/polyol phosphate export permease